VNLPATDPSLASIGAVLDALALGFASFIPSFGTLGDALALQWLRDPDVDDSDWVFADERVESPARLIVAQARDLGRRSIDDRRRSARRQSLFAALIDD
jgi:hypothetical protein